MKLILTEKAVEWFFGREYCPFEDAEKARLICDMRLNGETYRAIGNRVGLCKDRVREYVSRVQRTYERFERRSLIEKQRKEDEKNG